MPVHAELSYVARAALTWRQHRATKLAGGHAAHRDDARGLQVHLAADLRRERVHDVVADERIVDRVAVVAAPEVRVAVVDLEVAYAHGHDFHQRFQRREVDGRLIDLNVAILDPRLVVMPRRQIAGERDPDAGCQLRVQVQIRRRIVEPESDAGELVRVDGAHDVGRCRVAVRQVLELRGERRAEVQLEAGELDARILRCLERVDAALVERTVVLHRDRPSLLPGRLGRGCRGCGFCGGIGRRRLGSGRGRFRRGFGDLLRRGRRRHRQQRRQRGCDAKCGSHDRLLCLKSRVQ